MLIFAASLFVIMTKPLTQIKAVQNADSQSVSHETAINFKEKIQIFQEKNSKWLSNYKAF